MIPPLRPRHLVVLSLAALVAGCGLMPDPLDDTAAKAAYPALVSTEALLATVPPLPETDPAAAQAARAAALRARAAALGQTPG